MEQTQRDSPHVAVDGPALRRARHLAALSQAQLAKAAGIGQPYLSQIEAGTRPHVSAPVYGRLCDALGVTDRTTLMTPTTTKEQQ